VDPEALVAVAKAGGSLLATQKPKRAGGESRVSARDSEAGAQHVEN